MYKTTSLPGRIQVVTTQETFNAIIQQLRRENIDAATDHPERENFETDPAYEAAVQIPLNQRKLAADIEACLTRRTYSPIYVGDHEPDDTQKHIGCGTEQKASEKPSSLSSQDLQTII
uniref:Uncharacterized protein n=1 Tax=Talaromyces marneffei PM1 TaxID=1077442 RepID=A0A093VB09_TALMA